MSTGKQEPGETGRADLIERLNLAGRELSTATVMFHTAVAARRGLSATEEKAVDLLLRAGPMTHAELGQQTGLAPASVSGLIDRLELKGYVRRAPHPDDRRRILVTADAGRVYAEMAPLFAPWAEALAELYAGYTDAELETICDFMTRAAQRQLAAAEALTRRGAGPT
ncbi:MAG: MarR family transcriptional regulator [Streptosporangiaceae bacterium]